MAGVLSLQFTPKSGDKQFNLQKVNEIISEYSDKKLDLVVIPEFFSTGICDDAFINSPEDVNGGEVVKFLSETARKYNTNIVCGTASERDGESYLTLHLSLTEAGNL